MAILVVAGFTVPVSGPTGIQRIDEDIGGLQTRMLSGLMRETVRNRKRGWTVATRHLTSSERTSLYTALRSAPPVACTGDAVDGAATCFTKITSDQEVWTKGQIRYVVSFSLMEQ